SICSDPGQTHFTREDPSVVIVRSDKPDLQLSAINAGARSLIVTGDLPLLSYVLDRAREDEIPLLRTQLDTVKTVEAIDDLFGTQPFSGGDSKMARLFELFSGSPLLSLTAS
ncbi:MAG: DRTGG domain-containing protein, partial [Dehalococcoidia bacterium]